MSERDLAANLRPVECALAALECWDQGDLELDAAQGRALLCLHDLADELARRLARAGLSGPDGPQD